MGGTLHILVVDAEDGASLVMRVLSRDGLDAVVDEARTLVEVRAALDSVEYDAVLAGPALPSLRGLEILWLLQQRSLDVPFIVVAETIDITTAMAALQAGAADFILADQLERLAPTLHREIAAAAVRRDKRERDRLDAGLEQVERLIHSSLDFDEVLCPLLDTAVATLGADAALLVTRTSRAWHVKATTGELNAAEDMDIADDDLLLDPEVMLSRRVVATEDASTLLQPGLLDRVPIRSVVAIPLVIHAETAGGIGLCFLSEPHAFSSAEIAFAEKLGAAVSSALENARLHEETRAAAARAEGLNAINEVLLSTLDPDELLERVLVQAADAVGADVALLLSSVADRWRVRYSVGVAEEIVKKPCTHTCVFGMDLAIGLQRPVLVDDATADRAVRCEIAERLGVGSYMLLPLVVDGEVAAVVNLSFRDTSRFTPRDARFAEQLSSAMSLALGNARLFQQEHRIAEALQHALNASPASVPDIDHHAFYASATERAGVGGDFYDVFELGDGRIALVMGDVSGKGLAAAAVMALAKNVVRAHAIEGDEPAVLLSKVNNALFRFTGLESFVTMVYCILEPDGSAVLYGCAGHPPAFVLAEDGTVTKLDDSPNCVLGALPGARFDQVRAALPPGAIILLYTDGLLEARQGDEQYGEGRIEATMRRMAGQGTEAVVKALVGDVRLFTGGRLDDDVALMAVRPTRVPAAGESRTAPRAGAARGD